MFLRILDKFDKFNLQEQSKDARASARALLVYLKIKEVENLVKQIKKSFVPRYLFLNLNACMGHTCDHEKFMNRFDIISRMYNIHLLIEQEKTGTPDEFAKKFHLSRRQLYNVLEELKDYGAVFEYSRKKCSFHYIKEFHLSLQTLHFSSDNQ